MFLLTGCSSGEYTGSPAPTPVPSTTTTVAEVTVRGVVAQTLASARVVVLARPVSGIANVALSVDTEVVRANGAKATINDISARATIEATGRPSTADTLLARRIVVL